MRPLSIYCTFFIQFFLTVFEHGNTVFCLFIFGVGGGFRFAEHILCQKSVPNSSSFCIFKKTQKSRDQRIPYKDCCFSALFWLQIFYHKLFCVQTLFTQTRLDIIWKEIFFNFSIILKTQAKRMIARKLLRVVRRRVMTGRESVSWLQQALEKNDPEVRFFTKHF